MKKIYEILKREFPTDTVDISDGYKGNVHVVIISRKFDGSRIHEREGIILSLIGNNLTKEEKKKISVLNCYSPGELKR